MKNIVLIGLPGSGKSTLGRSLADKLQMPFMDMDDCIAKEQGMSVSEIFASRGEAFFRDCEAKMVVKLAQKHNTVIAAGGGMVLMPANIRQLRLSSILVFIDRPPELIAQDIEVRFRPLMQHDPQKIFALHQRRLDLYRRYADYILDNTGAPEEALTKLCVYAESLKKQAPQKFAVIGDPVAHSLSPSIHLAVLPRYYANSYYEKVQVAGGGLPAWLRLVKRENYAGFNLTMPHKLDIIPFLAELDDEACLLGSVNTVVCREGRLYGYNTDGRGFAMSLKSCGSGFTGANVLILGSGGVARTIALKAAQDGAATLTLLARKQNNLGLICNNVHDRFPAVPVRYDSCTPVKIAKCSAQADILINATPLGMAGTGLSFDSLDFIDALPPCALVCDLIYHPLQTALLKAAKARGLKTMGGLEMLIYQAILADGIFLGRNLPVSMLFSKVLLELDMI